MKTVNMKGMALGVAFGITGAVSAATPEAQVYDVCLSLRTTGAAIGTVNNKTNPIAMSWDDSESIVYRKPTNIEWRGLIWGCNCETIDGVWEEVNEIGGMGFSSIKGCVLWDTQTGKPVFMGNGADLSDVESVPGCGFGWDFVNAIGRGGNEVEGVWTMEQCGSLCDDDCQLYELHGSGFGRLRLNTCDDEVDCTSHILYMIGKVSGWMHAPSMTYSTPWSGCMFCGYEPGYSECTFPAAWAWGEFWDSESWMDFDAERTAVHGTWTYKYNEELSKRLSQPIKVTSNGIQGFIVSIRDVYNFADLPMVAAAILQVENYFWGIDPTGCDELAHALALAKQNTYAKEQALDAVSYENLKAAEVWAAAEVANCKAALAAAVAAYDATNMIYQASFADYVVQMDYTNNSTWAISYINQSAMESTVTGTGLATFDACVEELKFYTFTNIAYAYTICGDYAAAKAFIADQNAKTATLEAKKDADAANLAAAAADVTVAKKAYVVAQDNLAAARNDLANITLLQLKAWSELEKAMALEATAQKAYDDNGCCD